MVTLSRILEKFPIELPSGTLEYITAPDNALEVNKRILDLLIGLVLKVDDPYVAGVISIIVSVANIDGQASGLEKFDTG